MKCGRRPVCALFTCFIRADVNFDPDVRCISFVPQKPYFVLKNLFCPQNVTDQSRKAKEEQIVSFESREAKPQGASTVNAT